MLKEESKDSRRKKMNNIKTQVYETAKYWLSESEVKWIDCFKDIVKEKFCYKRRRK